MKTKVLTYANDGNTVCNKYMDISAVHDSENVFISFTDQLQRVNLVFKFNDVYYCEGNYNHNQIADNKDVVLNHYNTYLVELINKNWIQSIYIALFEALGMDATTLINKRNEIKVAKEIAAKVKQDEKEKQAEDYRQKRLNELNIAKCKLSAGEQISKDDFLELVKQYNIPVHIRTIGMLNKLTKADIGINKAHVIGANAKNVNLDKVFEAAKMLAAC